MITMPYFKFYVNEWITGDITLEDYETQGLFINICAYYLSKNGVVEIEKLNRKFSDAKPTAFDSLFNGILKNENGFVKIKFLDEQIAEYNNKKLVNSQNGAKGGRPKKQEYQEEKPTAFDSLNEIKANESNKEEKRKEDNNIKKKKKTDIIYPTLEEVETYFFEKGYNKQLAKTFYDYYSAAEWKDKNGSKVLSWKQKAIANWFKDENKTPQQQLQKPKDNSWMDTAFGEVNPDFKRTY